MLVVFFFQFDAFSVTLQQSGYFCLIVSRNVLYLADAAEALWVVSKRVVSQPSAKMV